MTLSIEHVTQADDDVRALIGALDAELGANYEPEQRHALDIDGIFQPHIKFFVARQDGTPAGCGGVAFFTEFAEVKRMYVREALRGQGIANAIMARIEDEALAVGYSCLRLETGIHQKAAIRFYKRWGFASCPIFEPYASKPAASIVTSVFLEKELIASS